MENKRRYTRLTFDAIIREANKYATRSRFAKHAQRAYLAALKSGMLDYLFPKRQVIVRVSPDIAQLKTIKPVVIPPPVYVTPCSTLTDADMRYMERDILEITDEYDANSPALLNALNHARRQYALDGPDHVAYFDALLRKNNLI